MATKAKLISPLAAGLEDVNGVPYSGALVVSYIIGTSTEKAVWEDRDKTQPTSAGKTQWNLDTKGRSVVFGDGVYDIKIFSAGANPAVDTPLHSFAWEGYGGVGEQPVATLAALKALTPVAGDTVHMLGRLTGGDGGQGHFRWDASDLSTEVTADTQTAIYVPPNSDATGASGAWVRLYNGAVDIKWFGAKGDGATDNTTAIQAAIDIGLGPIFVPLGVFCHTGLTFPDTSGVIGTHWGSILKNTAIDGSHSLLFEGEATVPADTGRNIEQLVQHITLQGNASCGDGVRLEMIGRVDNGVTDTEPSNCIINHAKIIDHGGSGVQFGESASVGAGNKVTISDSLIAYNDYGVKVLGQSNTASITSNTISNNTNDGVYFNFVASTNMVLHNQIMDNGRYGVYCFSTEQPLIICNGFNRNEYGALVFTGDGTKSCEAAVALGNLFGDNGALATTQRELQISYTKGVTVQSNYFYGTGQDEMIYLSDYVEGCDMFSNYFKNITTETKLSIKGGAVSTWYTYTDFDLLQTATSQSSVSVSSGAVDLSTSKMEMHAISVGENITSITFPASPTAGQRVSIRFKQVASYTVSGWPADVNLIGGAYSISTTGRIDILNFQYISSEWVEVSRAAAVI